jgi:transposase
LAYVLRISSIAHLLKVEVSAVTIARMPDEFYDLVAHHLPPEQPVGPTGGRPRIRHRIALRVIWFILVTGNRWEDAPHELGCSGRTAHRRLQAWEEAGIWDRLHADLLRLLRKADKLDTGTAIVDSVIVRAFGGGEQTGPSPVDRRKTGTKHTLLVNRQGVPLAIRTAPANASDHTQIIPLVIKFPVVGGKPGRPKELPDEAYADRGYDSESTRWILRWLGIEPHIAKRNTSHGSGLGKVRWVVERTIGWIKGLRRMRVRYDRLAIIRDAFSTLAMAVVCFRILNHDCF